MDYIKLINTLKESNKKEDVNGFLVNMAEYDFAFEIEGFVNYIYENRDLNPWNPNIFLKKDRTEILVIDPHSINKIKLDEETKVDVKKMESLMHAFYFKRNVYKFNSVEDLNNCEGIFFRHFSVILVNGVYYNIEKA